MAYKPVGVDENSKFPTAVANVLKNLFVGVDANNNLETTVFEKLKSTLVTVDANGNLSALATSRLKSIFATRVVRHTPRTNGGIVCFGVPGMPIWTTATISVAANVIRYTAFEAANPVTITAYQYEVTTASAASNLRIGIYAADANWQPTGAPLYDSGVLSVAASGTGVVTQTFATPLSLPVGRYVTALIISSGLSFRYSGSGVSFVVPTLGASTTPYCFVTGTASVNNSFPNPPTAWTSQLLGTSGHHSLVIFQYTEA